MSESVSEKERRLGWWSKYREAALREWWEKLRGSEMWSGKIWEVPFKDLTEAEQGELWKIFSTHVDFMDT